MNRRTDWQTEGQTYACQRQRQRTDRRTEGRANRRPNLPTGTLSRRQKVLVLPPLETRRSCYCHWQTSGLDSQTTEFILEYHSVQHCLKPKLFYNLRSAYFSLSWNNTAAKSGNARLTAQTSQACQASQAGNYQTWYFDHCQFRQCNFFNKC